MTYIYISYEPVDHALAAHVKGVLEASGFTSWYDETRLEPTAHPSPPRIEDVIFASAALVGIVPQSGATPRVLQEAEYARQMGKPVYWLQNASDLDAILARLPRVINEQQNVYALPRPFDYDEFQQNERDNAPSPTFFIIGGVLTLAFTLLALYGIVIVPSSLTPPSALTRTASLQILMFTLSAPAPATQVISSPTPRPAFPTAIPTATLPAVAIVPSSTPARIPTHAETSTAALLDLTLTSLAIALTQAAQQMAEQPTADSAGLATAPSPTSVLPTAAPQIAASDTPSPVPASATPSFTWMPSPSPTLTPSQTNVPPTLTPSWTHTAGLTSSVTASPTWTVTASHTAVLTHTPSLTFTPTPTAIPSQTATPTPTATPARLPVGFDNRAWTPNIQMYKNTSLVFVPAGCYLSISADVSVQPEEICVESHWLGQYEVTNAAYAACVSAGVCSPPASFASSTRLNYYDSPAFADFPVIHVTWQQATDYAAWLGGHLPSSSEWRYAAQGPANFLYPWGSDEPTGTRLNFNGMLQDTSRTGIFPAGASWVGALDMAGNVWEWVDPSPEISASLLEDDAVIVGGSWNSFGSLVQSSYAAPKPRNSSDVFTGFRVAFDANVFELLDSD